MRSMQRNFGVLGVLCVSLIATANIKHLPISQLFTLSGVLVLTGCILAVGFSIGFKNVLLAFLGYSAETAESLIRAIFLTSCVWALICAQSVFANLSTPDLIGPGVAGAIVSLMYGLLLAGYLSIVNKVTKLATHFLFFVGAILFVNVSLTMTVLYSLAVHT